MDNLQGECGGIREGGHRTQAQAEARSAELGDPSVRTDARTKRAGFSPRAFPTQHNQASDSDDLDHPVRPGIDQHRPVVDHRVAIVANAVFSSTSWYVTPLDGSTAPTRTSSW